MATYIASGDFVPREHAAATVEEQLYHISMTMRLSTRISSVATMFLLLLAAEALAQPTFINKIPIPPLIDAATDTIHLEMRVMTHKFNPANPSDSLNGGTSQPNGITAFAYNLAGDSTMTLLGPTLKLHTYGKTAITLKNLIGQPTTTHWHGAEVPAMMDGGPHDGIAPGATWSVDFTTIDSASTMWYHPHYHNTTVQHVQKGLSGMIIVEQPGDPIFNTMPRTYGVDDIPVIIGDLGFTTGSNRTAGMAIDTGKGKRPYNLVNGVTNPYVEVPAHLVRLRILNGSTRKGILFGVSTSYSNPASKAIPFYLIATDGGYMITPDTLTQLLNGPGARDEIVLDLSGRSPGDTLYLSNLKSALPSYVVGSSQKAPNGGGQDTTIGTAFLQLRIVADSVFNGYTPVTSFMPFTTVWTPGLSDTLNIAKHRLKRLINMPGGGFTIDSLTYDMEFINDTVCVDTKEIWAIRNESNTAHPFHIHKIQFRTLDVTDSAGNNVPLEPYGMNGPKDDVLILPGWTLRFLGQYDDYPSEIDPMNTYMYHCHILTHEDAMGGGMMHQFVVTNCSSSVVAPAAGDKAPTMELIPSPAQGIAYLKGSSSKRSTVTIIDIQGHRLRTQQLPAFDGSAVIDISGLPGGAYLVEWRAQNGITTGKMVVAK